MPLLTSCMRDVVSMCLDARVRLVYPAETYGCPSPCRQLQKNVQPLLCVLDYVRSQNDRAVLEKLHALNLEEDTIVVFVSDHGETLYDHDCYFDHHGMYEPTLVVQFIVVWKNHQV